MSELFSISQETFLKALGVAEIERRMRGHQQRAQLYKIVVDALYENGTVVGSAKWRGGVNELPLRIPGTALNVRLSRAEKDDLTALILAAFLVINSGHSDVKTLTLAALVALRGRVSRLRAEYGERSVVDALSEVSRGTAQEITLVLRGNSCRFPRAGCRFLAPDGINCSISLGQVEDTLRHLVDESVLKTKNAVGPYEYGFII